jgi:hypothetical protein
MFSPDPLVAHFAGLDWAKQHHYVVIVNAGGQIVAEFSLRVLQTQPMSYQLLKVRESPHGY